MIQCPKIAAAACATVLSTALTTAHAPAVFTVDKPLTIKKLNSVPLAIQLLVAHTRNTRMHARARVLTSALTNAQWPIRGGRKWQPYIVGVSIVGLKSLCATLAA